jgi:hypothetical protein
MSDVISEYQRWKQQGEGLRAQAKHAMESRFKELMVEAVHLSDEYRADFGASLKPPPPVTAFRYKASARPKAKKAAKPKEAPPPAPPPSKPDPKVTGLQKKLATAKKKLDEAKAAGSPTRAIEDRIYELEDDLRLAAQA